MASKVADTIIAGGQGMKEKVVESTEQAIALAKPKIKEGLMAIAWKVCLYRGVYTCIFATKKGGPWASEIEYGSVHYYY